MHDAQQSQSQLSGDETWPARPSHATTTDEEVETGQRHRAVRAKQQHWTTQTARSNPAPRQRRNKHQLRSRLLSVLLLVVLTAVLLLVFLMVFLPTRQSSTLLSERSITITRSRSALRRAGVLYDQLPRKLHTDAAALQRLLAFYADEGDDAEQGSAAGAAAAHRQPLLVVQVAHGLSNRLRTFASALVFAHHFKLAFRLIWLPDHHCRATFTQLFVLPNASDPSSMPPDASHSPVSTTWRRFRAEQLCESDECAIAAQHLSDEHFDLYRYIDAAGQASDERTPIVPPSPGRSLFVHASTRLNHSLAVRDMELWTAMSVIQPAGVVTALLDAFSRRYPTLRLDTALGLHIRQQQPAAELAGLQQNEYSPSAWAALAAARRLSDVAYFEQLVSTTLDQAPQLTFYVATDTPTAIAQLRQQFGEQRFVSVRDVAPTAAACDGRERAAECIQLALADQLLLSRCRSIHGSVWSTFSEMASLWRMAPVSYPPGAVQQVLAVAAGRNTSGAESGGGRVSD